MAKLFFGSKILIFDLNGQYINTLGVGNDAFRMFYDEENNRFILSLNEEMQFAYLDLDGNV